MDEVQAYPPPGRCPVHDVDATRLCERCGSYVCDACDDGGAERACVACRERVDLTRFPIQRGSFTVGEAIRVGHEAFTKHWGPLVGAQAIYFVVATLFGGARVALDLAGYGLAGGCLALINMLVGWFIVMGLVAMAHDSVDDRQPEVGRMFSQFAKLWKMALVALLVWMSFVPFGLALVPMLAMAGGDAPEIGALLSLGLMLALLPLYTYVMLGWAFVANVLVDEGLGPIAALRRSWALASGHRLAIFGIYLVFGVTTLLGMLACCVGVVPAVAWTLNVQAAMYRGLSNGMAREARGPRTF